MLDYYVACYVIFELIMLDSFKQFLGAKERLPEKNIPYHVKWVSDCCDIARPQIDYKIRLTL